MNFVDAITLLAGCRDMSDEVRQQVDALRLSLHLNLAMCCIKLGDKWQKCADNCTEALKIDADNTKALFRRATAREHLGELDEALVDAKRAATLAADDKAITRLIARLDAKIERRAAKEKANLRANVW